MSPLHRVYLDHAATTVVRPEAVHAMAETMAWVGNPSSPHSSGRAVRRVVEEARESVAADLGVRPSEVIFTAGGTEADNLAVKGLYWARSGADTRRRRVLSSAVEHHAVLDAVGWLGRRQGAEVERVPVDRSGRVDPRQVEGMLARAPDTVALLTVMWANNEVGTVQPIAQLAQVAARYGVPLHVDAVQAIGAVPVEPRRLGVPSLALSGHKFGGPVGTGVLVLSQECTLQPLLHGGGQERDVRSGTLDAAGAVGLAVALRRAVAEQEVHARWVSALRDRLEAGVLDAVPDAVLNGDRLHRLPGIAHVSLPGCDGDALLMLLDAQGVDCATGSACSAGVPAPSHVLLAMGHPDALATGSLRFSFGRTSTAEDVSKVLAVLPEAVDRARAAGRLHAGRA